MDHEREDYERELAELLDRLEEAERRLTPEYIQQKLQEALGQVADPGADPGMPEDDGFTGR